MSAELRYSTPIESRRRCSPLVALLPSMRATHSKFRTLGTASYKNGSRARRRAEFHGWRAWCDRHAPCHPISHLEVSRTIFNFAQFDGADPLLAEVAPDQTSRSQPEQVLLVPDASFSFTRCTGPTAASALANPAATLFWPFVDSMAFAVEGKTGKNEV
jgi:hypothetical protein